MKRTISIILVLCIAFSTVACKGTSNLLPETPEETPSTPTPQPQATPTPAPAPEPEETPENDVSMDAILARPLMDPEKGALYGYTDGYEELRYEVRYMFEQVALPMTVLSFEEEVSDVILNGDTQSLEELVSLVWENAMIVVVAEDFETRGKLIGINEATEDQVLDYIDYMRDKSDLSLEKNIVTLTIEELDKTTKAAFLTLTATGWPLLCEYIAIVFNETEGLAYYTLERSYDEGDNTPYFFCFVNLNGRGTFYTIENTPEAFTGAILDEDKEVGTQQSR